VFVFVSIGKTLSTVGMINRHHFSQSSILDVWKPIPCFNLAYSTSRIVRSIENEAFGEGEGEGFGEGEGGNKQGQIDTFETKRKELRWVWRG